MKPFLWLFSSLNNRTTRTTNRVGTKAIYSVPSCANLSITGVGLTDFNHPISRQSPWREMHGHQ